MSADQADRPISLPIESGRENWLRLVRNKKQRERYGPAHRRRRRDFARRIERGEIFSCARCGEEIGPGPGLGARSRRSGSVAELPVASLV